FRHRLAGAIQMVRHRLMSLLEPRGDQHASVQPSTDDASGLRLSGIPPLERPTGPGKRDRAAMHAATLVRGVEARIGALDELIERSHGAAAHAKGVQLLDLPARSLG